MVLGIKSRKDTKSESAMVRMFSAVGDPTRFKLVRILARRENICVSEIAEEVGISTAGASQHLKILENAGLVDRNRMGQKICYTVNKNSADNKKLFEMVL